MRQKQESPERSAFEPIGWGVIGCAGIAQKTCEAIAEAFNAQTVAVASRSLAKASNFVNAHAPGAKSYDSYGDVLSDDKVHAVCIPLPTAMKKEWVLKAAAHKNMCCAKNQLQQITKMLRR